MFQLTFVTGLLVIPCVFTQLCHRKYSSYIGCDNIYGTVLGSSNNTRSVLECTKLCSEHRQCLSVKYVEDQKLCEINTNSFWIIFSFGCTSFARYAKVTESPCQKLINDVCTVSSECTVANSRCTGSSCQCDPGYSYDQYREVCSTSCMIYGSSFTLHPGYNIDGHNDREFGNVISGDDCEKACADETSFVCRTADYSSTAQHCILSGATSLTAPHSLSPAADYNHYHRNCA